MKDSVGNSQFQDLSKAAVWDYSLVGICSGNEIRVRLIQKRQ